MAAARGVPTQRWVALLRGINVGGHRPVPMAALREAFEALGAGRPRTVVQSGNVVFDHALGERDAAALRTRLEAGLASAFGFGIPVLVRSARRFEETAVANPFAADAAEPTHGHVWFLEAAPPAADRAGLDRLKAASERWHLEGDAFYLHAPEGVGRSKLAAGAERLLGVAATARNLRTVQALRGLLAD